MAVVTRKIHVRTKGDSDILDLTNDLETELGKTKLKDGTVTAFVPGSTAGLTTVEYEPGLVKDLKRFFERIAPQGERYAHEETWHDGNGHSHVRASFLGPSLSVPFTNGKLILGTWQQLILIDFDNRPRSRDIILQFVGE
jgi:secondary thiamine-phosphate synthase enzyme